MSYINIDTEKGIFGVSTVSKWGDFKPRVGRVSLEARAKNWQIIRENGVEYNGETLYRFEPSEARVVGDVLKVSCFVGHAQNGDWYAGKVIGAWSDSATFEPGTLEWVKVHYADPPTTILKDANLVAEDVIRYPPEFPWKGVTVVAIGLSALASVFAVRK